MDRGEYNTRMRDLFDVVMLKQTQAHLIDPQTLSDCIIEVSKERGTLENLYNYHALISELAESQIFNRNFENYKNKAYPDSEITLKQTFNVFTEIYDNLKSLLPENEHPALGEKIQSAGSRAANKKNDASKTQKREYDR